MNNFTLRLSSFTQKLVYCYNQHQTAHHSHGNAQVPSAGRRKRVREVSGGRVFEKGGARAAGGERAREDGRNAASVGGGGEHAEEAAGDEHAPHQLDGPHR